MGHPTETRDQMHPECPVFLGLMKSGFGKLQSRLAGWDDSFLHLEAIQRLHCLKSGECTG